jgi:hypothetical protein
MEDVHIVQGHCWLCDDPIDLVKERTVRISSWVELYGAVCSKEGCQEWADDRDKINGQPTKDWPERVEVPNVMFR